MADSLSVYLRLRLSTDLTPASRYNLQKIDDAFSRLTVSLDADTVLRSASDILIEPESADIGGTGIGGTVNVGTPSHVLTAFNVYGPSFFTGTTSIAGRLALKDESAGAQYLQVRYDSTLAGVTDPTGRLLSLDVQGADRNIILGGNLTLGGALTTGSTLTTVGAFSTSASFSTGGVFSTTGTFSSGGAFSTASTFSAAAAVSLGAAVTTVGALITGGAFSTAAALTFAGAFPATLTFTGPTAVTFPTSGLLASTSGVALTPLRALVSDASGFVAASSVTSTELGFLSGTTSSVQTQLNAKASTLLNNLTVPGLSLGDLLYATSSSALSRLPIGVAGTVLTSGGTVPIWSSPTSSGDTVMVRVSYVDLTATTLPAGTTYSPDGTPVVDGDLVLFTDLLAGNSRVYSVSGVGVALVWTPVSVWTAGFDPTAGDQAVAKGGTALGGGVAIGHFDGTLWRFNRTIRQFEGADYVETSGPFTTTLADNTTANVFTVLPTGSENWRITFSLVRGATREVGTLHLVTDGTTAAVAESGVDLSVSAGVTFTADISGGLLRLRYTTTSTGTAAVMKWHHDRWSSAAGGPASVPNYSVSAGSVPASGVTGSVQLRGSTGFLDSDTDFAYDMTEDAINQNGTLRQKRATATLADNQVAATDAFTVAGTWRYVIAEYGLTRGADRQVGRLLLTHDGAATAYLSDDNLVSSPAMGVTFSATFSAGVLHIQYTTTATGTAVSMAYNIVKFDV